VSLADAYISPNALTPRPVEEIFAIHRTAMDFFSSFAGVPPNVLIGIPITSWATASSPTETTVPLSVCSHDWRARRGRARARFSPATSAACQAACAVGGAVVVVACSTSAVSPIANTVVVAGGEVGAGVDAVRTLVLLDLDVLKLRLAGDAAGPDQHVVREFLGLLVFAAAEVHRVLIGLRDEVAGEYFDVGVFEPLAERAP